MFLKRVPLVTLEEDDFQRYRRSKLQIVKELGERLQTEGDPTKHGIMMAAVLL